MMHQSSATIADVVIPLIEVSGTPPNLRFERLLGSGFLVGNSSYLMTAAHVIRSGNPGYVVALRTIDREFITIQLDDIVFHPTEDVAICRVRIDNHVSSWLYPTENPGFQTLDCQIWGYPDDVLYEGDEKGSDGRILQRPELVFMKGYIRRRISYSVPGFSGKQFYEINDSAGAGCSGGPLIR